MSLVERLNHDPRSMWRAKKAGGPEHLGFGITEHQLAALIDALNANTAVTAAHGSGKRPKQPKPAYRPNTRIEREHKPKSVREMTNVLALAMKGG